MSEQPDPNIFTPPPIQESDTGFDFTKVIRAAGEPISVGTDYAKGDVFEELTKSVTVPSHFVEPIPHETPIALSAYPPGKPRYDNIRVRLF